MQNSNIAENIIQMKMLKTLYRDTNVETWKYVFVVYDYNKSFKMFNGFANHLNF